MAGRDRVRAQPPCQRVPQQRMAQRGQQGRRAPRSSSRLVQPGRTIKSVPESPLLRAEARARAAATEAGPARFASALRAQQQLLDPAERARACRLPPTFATFAWRQPRVSITALRRRGKTMGRSLTSVANARRRTSRHDTRSPAEEHAIQVRPSRRATNADRLTHIP